MTAAAGRAGFEARGVGLSSSSAGRMDSAVSEGEAGREAAAERHDDAVASAWA